MRESRKAQTFVANGICFSIAELRGAQGWRFCLTHSEAFVPQGVLGCARCRYPG